MTEDTGKNLLSQEEIDALLSKSSGGKTGSSKLETHEKDAIGEIGNISMGSSATALSTILNKKVRITTPKVEITTMAELRKKYPIPFVSIEVEYTKGLEGINVLIMKESDANVIADLMMGGTGVNVEGKLDEIKLSAVGEAMNQMMGTAATSMSMFFKKDINISPPKVELLDFTAGTVESDILSEGQIVRVGFELTVENLIKSEIMQLLPISFAKRLVEELTGTDTPPEMPPHETQDTKTSAIEPSGTVEVKPVIFNSFDKTAELRASKSNIELIMDVPLEITVELGRTMRLIKDILNIGSGSIIELDRLAGEPVDILVNGKIFAKGEVVVIDENFGIRVTDIISPQERIKGLQ